MRKNLGRLVPVAFLGLALIVGATVSPIEPLPAAAAAPAPAAVSVEMGDNYFYPWIAYASSGDTILWPNVGVDYHTASSDSFETDGVGPGEQGSATLWETGWYYYYCLLHAEMDGWILVE